MSTLRVAVWGLGRHAVERILPAVSAARGLELYGVCTRDAGRAAACSETWKCRAWTDAAAMLADAAVDAVYVATPTGLHAEHGRQVLDAGKHLWCEKPFTCRLTSTLDLLERSRRLKLSACEGHMYLHHPQFRQLSGYIAEGRLGAVRSMACRFGIPPLDFQSFRSDPALGGGALLDVGCYPISAVQALFPAGACRVAYSRLIARDGSTVDTDGVAVIEFDSGVVAELEWRTHCAYRNEIDVWGDRGSVSTYRIFSKPATYVPVFHFRDLHGEETLEQGEAGNHFVAMLESFGAMIPDAGQCEDERRRVARRAAMLDDIREKG